ncbi:MAG: hypothetical protein AVDCRST_MAG33-1892, partial [uncultured Thermomicrobiales bacterium]
VHMRLVALELLLAHGPVCSSGPALGRGGRHALL